MASHKEILKKFGFHVDDSHTGTVTGWRSIYEGEGPDNFEPRVMVDKATGKASALAKSDTVRKDSRKKRSYKAHIKACKKWAGLFFNEQTELQVSDTVPEGTASIELAFLEDHYENAGLWPLLEENFPEMFGMGTVAVVTEYSSEFGIVHKWMSAENILPIEVCHGRIRSVVFVSEFEKEGKKYTLYNIHEERRNKKIQANGEKGVKLLPSGVSEYDIWNLVFEGDKELPAEQFGLVGAYTSPVRLFAIFKPFNRKIKDFNNAFGIPVYYDDFDQIAEIDELYDIKHDDTQKSRRNIFIDKDALTYDENGRANIPQYLYGTVVSTKALDGIGGAEKFQPITEFSPVPNMDKYSVELQAALNRFSDAVGLGSDAFKIDRGQIATATQIVSENQEKYTNLKKHLSILASEFMVLNRSILSVAKENEGRADIDPLKPIGFFIQDSVIVNDEIRREIAMREVGDGLRSVESYLEEFRGLSGEELEEELALLQDSSDMDDLVGRLSANGPDRDTGKGKKEEDDPEEGKSDKEDEDN